jgi:hypothetical protein
VGQGDRQVAGPVDRRRAADVEEGDGPVEIGVVTAGPVAGDEPGGERLLAAEPVLARRRPGHGQLGHTDGPFQRRIAADQVVQLDQPGAEVAAVDGAVVSARARAQGERGPAEVDRPPERVLLAGELEQVLPPMRQAAGPDVPGPRAAGLQCQGGLSGGQRTAEVVDVAADIEPGEVDAVGRGGELEAADGVVGDEPVGRLDQRDGGGDVRRVPRDPEPCREEVGSADQVLHGRLRGRVRGLEGNGLVDGREIGRPVGQLDQPAAQQGMDLRLGGPEAVAVDDLGRLVQVCLPVGRIAGPGPLHQGGGQQGPDP